MLTPLPTWTKWVALPLLVLACLAAGYSAGHLSAPVETVTQTEIKVVTREKVVEKIVDRWHEAKTRIVYTEKTSKPDGSIVEKTSTKEDSVADASRDDSKVTDKSTENEQKSSKQVVNRPDWRVGVLAGAALQTPAIQITGPLVLGVQVERRIVGGISLGIWGVSSGAGGLSLSLEF